MLLPGETFVVTVWRVKIGGGGGRILAMDPSSGRRVSLRVEMSILHHWSSEVLSAVLVSSTGVHDHTSGMTLQAWFLG